MIRVRSGSIHVSEIVIFPAGSRTVDGVVILVKGIVLVQEMPVDVMTPRASTTPPDVGNLVKAVLTTEQKSSLVVQEPPVLQNALASMKADDAIMPVPVQAVVVHMALYPSWADA
jgi:hypothetical protein